MYKTLVKTVKGRADNETQVTKSRSNKKGGETEIGCKAQKIQGDETIKIKHRNNNRS